MVWKVPGVNVQHELARAFKSQGVGTVTLQKRAAAARTAGHGAGGNNPTMTAYTVRALVSDFTLGYLQLGGDAGGATTVQAGDRKVLIFGDSLPKKTDGSGDHAVVPEVDDQVLVEGKIYSIFYVERDPFGATYDCAVR